MYEYGREKLDVNHFQELFEAYAMALVNNVLFTPGNKYLHDEWCYKSNLILIFQL